MDNTLTITPLGGLGEIGLNCQLWECGGHVAMIVCGLMFPEDSHLGVDVLVPHFGAVAAIKDKLSGIVLTHGHEDHIGALPWIIPELKGAKIYGSRFTLALARHKLEEHKLLGNVELCPVSADTELQLGPMKFHFFPVCHSIPHGFGLGVETPAGRIIHSGDFKLDPSPLMGDGTDLELFRNFAGPEGARLLLSDSTNVMRPGHSLSEREVQDSLERIFSQASGRIVVTLFSSHIQRIQEVFDLASKYGKSVIISGKSLANNIDIASSLGYASLPPRFYNAFYGVPDLPPEETVILVTGAQGEPLSALSRMVWNEHRQLSIEKGDTVIMSSRVIPGNTRAISRLINEMYRLGAEVYYESSHAVHATGHGQREELKQMLEAVRPQIFMPVHGEYEHLVMHGRLAEEAGVKKENILIIEDGQPISITPDNFRLETPVQVEYTFVDGKGVGDVGASVLRERKILGDEGIVIISIVLENATGLILKGPEITSFGFIYEQQLNHVLEGARNLIKECLETTRNPLELKELIRGSLRRYFKRILERDPLVVPVVAAV